MPRGWMLSVLRFLGLPLLAVGLAIAPGLSAQQGGVITGRVTEQGSGRPLASARV